MKVLLLYADFFKEAVFIIISSVLFSYTDFQRYILWCLASLIQSYHMFMCIFFRRITLHALWT